MKQIYLKTAKGTEEIKTRAGGLIPRLRQALIFVDGRRTTDDLYAMLKAENLAETLASLVEQGYIELSIPAESVSPVASAVPAVAVAAAPAVEEKEPEETRESSYNFMNKM